jgi:hypothetical protein
LNNSTATSTVSNFARHVNSKRKTVSKSVPKTLTSTQLIPVLLRRGQREEIYWLPTCAVCGEPIRDFEEANVVTIGHDSGATLESLGALGGGEAFRLSGTAVVVHFGCDRHKWVPWVRSSSVFCKDQRGPIEKLGWTGVCE